MREGGVHNMSLIGLVGLGGHVKREREGTKPIGGRSALECTWNGGGKVRSPL